MVKNSGINQPTDMVRLGRLTDSEQPKNSIVFNASDKKIRDIKHSGLYISPIRNASASNLLAYDSITNEVIDIGGKQLKIDDLQVKNFEALNMKILNEERVYTPMLQIGEGCSNKENVGLDMHGMTILNDKSTGKLCVNENTKFSGSVEATQFIGDGGLLSNVQYDLNIDIGDVVENLHVVGELKADGGLLSNITVSQITDFSGYSPTFSEMHVDKDVKCGRSMYINNRIHSKGNINSDGNVIASAFYGDGTKLTGVSTVSDLEKTNSVVSYLEKQIPRFQPLEKAKTKLDEAINKTKTELNKQVTRFEPIETTLTTLTSRISNVEPKLVHVENQIPRIKDCESKISDLRKEVQTLPELDTIKKQIISINEQIPIIHETKRALPIAQSNETKIKQIENKIGKLSEINEIKQTLTKFKHVYGQLERFNPLEQRMSLCEESIEKTIDLPNIRTRLSVLENAPLEGDGCLISNVGLTHILSCQNDSEVPLVIRNDITANKIVTQGVSQVTSRLGEIKSISMGSLAELNVYTKANNGTTAGNPGGIVFRTRGIDGKMDARMTLDGNGKLALGTHKSEMSSILTLESKTSGFLPPRMSREDMENIKNPVPGLMVYDAENDALCVYKKSGWTEIK